MQTLLDLREIFLGLTLFNISVLSDCEAVYEMSRRITRSQTVCLAKLPVFATSLSVKQRQSEPSKRCTRNSTTETNQPATKKKSTNALISLPKKESVSEVDPNSQIEKPESTSKRRLSAAKVKNASKGKNASAAVVKDKQQTLAGKEKSIPKATFEPAHQVHVSQNSTSTTVSPTFSSDTVKESVFQVPNVPLRLRLRSTKALTPVPKKAKVTEVDPKSQTEKPGSSLKGSISAAKVRNSSKGKNASAAIVKDKQQTPAGKENSIPKATLEPADRTLEHQVHVSQNSTVSQTLDNHIGPTPSRKPLSTKPARRRYTISESITPTTDNDKKKLTEKRVKPTATKYEVILSDDLKRILLDDSKFVNTQKKLYEIPFDCNVAEVVSKYVALKKDKTSSSSDKTSINYVAEGIIEYFEVLIGQQLLYESEMAQYRSLLENFPEEAMSKLYPPIYLLRLLIQFNKLMKYRHIDEETMKCYLNHLNEFVKYLAENKATFFNLNIYR